MKEIELKILDINKKKLEAQLHKLGAKNLGKVFIRYKRYDFKDKRIGKSGSLLRLRTNGNKVQFTYKGPTHKSAHFKIQDETETEVKDFATAEKILNSIGLKEQNCIEKYRTSYLLAGTRLEIDEHPLIPPYVEIEGSEKAIRHVLHLLNIDIKDTTPIGGQAVLRKYGVNSPFVTFKKYGHKHPKPKHPKQHE
jgi:adenylate cyclase class 2